ncbi:polysaccharide deacetylase family protein [Desulfosporosinus nitroreducens]|uniref:Polysaccharide deacetylase family protein n=1 Tax=Desulfosporosinus nitroreducens TaxID=2018668 RepID=A0ABT8QJI4_9FIRM|nr:polysaccharide deacetylase family protein [Desulfosporosinus nitroreducens]MCO1600394.1 polysaccharide deacetylase family protein [Desulfosporosinus nitroreducens]MDO0821482.1 polysaccharide deacetylase family protein [Desulfosporosinus nitroreducens]
MRIIIFKRPSWRNVALWGILLFVMLAYRENVTSVFSGKLKPIYSVNVNTKAIGLTFDISWGEKTAEPILDILRKEEIQATFFLSSPWAEKHQELVRKMIVEGHEIGSHGNRHIDLNTLGAEEIRKEITSAQQVLEKITGQKIRLIRTPNGAYNNKVIATADELGYRVIQWSVDSLDWKRPGPSAVVNNVLNGPRPGTGAKPGDIILFHASDSAPDTIEALPTVIQSLKSKGNTLLPVGKLLSQSSSTWPPESNLKEEALPAK